MNFKGTNPGKREVDRDKCLGGKTKFTISKRVSEFLVFYDRSSGVRH